MATEQIRPEYYGDSKIEPIDIIRDWNLSFNLGSVVKYIKRKKKAETIDKRIEDLRKAITYFEFEIEDLLTQQKDRIVIANNTLSTPNRVDMNKHLCTDSK